MTLSSSIFFVVSVIGLMPLINLLDGLSLSWGGIYSLFIWDFYRPLATFVEKQFFWLKILFFSVFPFLFLSFWLHHLIVAVVPVVFGIFLSIG